MFSVITNLYNTFLTFSWYATYPTNFILCLLTLTVEHTAISKRVAGIWTIVTCKVHMFRYRQLNGAYTIPT